MLRQDFVFRFVKLQLAMSIVVLVIYEKDEVVPNLFAVLEDLLQTIQCSRTDGLWLRKNDSKALQHAQHVLDEVLDLALWNSLIKTDNPLAQIVGSMQELESAHLFQEETVQRRRYYSASNANLWQSTAVNCDVVACSLDGDAKFLQEHLAVACREQFDLLADVVVALRCTNRIFELKRQPSPSVR